MQRRARHVHCGRCEHATVLRTVGRFAPGESVSSPIVVGSDACGDFAQSSKLEWLETNGTGAFAMGTVAGVNTRRYHGLLVAALHPRCVLLSRVEEEVELDGRTYALGVVQYPGV